MPDEKANVIKDVDRLVFNCPDNVTVRASVYGQLEWKHLAFGKDFVQFTMATE